MKKLLLILVLGLLSVGCNRKEDKPSPRSPHVAGVWQGNGTDDAIGYYNLSVDMGQSQDSAAGTFTMVGDVATVTGDFYVSFGPAGGNNVRTLTLTRQNWTVADPANANRVCAGTLTVRGGSTYITDSALSFHYTMTDCQGGTWNGGANLRKSAGTN